MRAPVPKYLNETTNRTDPARYATLLTKCFYGVPVEVLANLFKDLHRVQMLTGRGEQVLAELSRMDAKARKAKK